MEIWVEIYMDWSVWRMRMIESYWNMQLIWMVTVTTVTRVLVLRTGSDLVMRTELYYLSKLASLDWRRNVLK